MGRHLGAPVHNDRHAAGGGDAFAAADVLEATVKRLQTSTGPTTLLLGAVADGELLRRSGTAVVGVGGSHILNGFRLTLTSGVPVPSGDVTGATTLYLTPHTGAEVWTYDSSVWTRHVSAEVSQALGTLSNATNYDVFVYWGGAALALELVAWTNDTTRATALARQDGVWTKSGDASRRYVGTFRTTATTTTEDSNAKRFLWNVDNRVWRGSRQQDTTASWSTTSTTFVAANGGDPDWKHEFVVGLDEDEVDALADARMNTGSTSFAARMGIQFDATTGTALGSMVGSVQNTTGEYTQAYAIHKLRPGIGYHFFQATNASSNGSTATFNGGADCIFTTETRR